MKTTITRQLEKKGTCTSLDVLDVLTRSQVGLTKAEAVEAVCASTGATPREARSMFKCARVCMMIEKVEDKFYATFYDPETGHFIDEKWKALM